MSGVRELSVQEMLLCNGGGDGVTTETSLIQDISFYVGRTARGFWEWCKMAAEFQESLPPNLKK